MHKEYCPYCKSICEADWVDVGVGMQQCGPFYCTNCYASQIGPFDKERELTEEELNTGWYGPGEPPGSSANVVGGKIVDHETAKQVYEKFYPFSATDSGREMIRESSLEDIEKAVEDIKRGFKCDLL